MRVLSCVTGALSHSITQSFEITTEQLFVFIVSYTLLTLFKLFNCFDIT